MNYKQISGTAQIKPMAGRLKSILVSSTSTGTLKVYDSPDGDTGDPVIIETLTPAANDIFDFSNGLWFNNGCYMVIANSLEITVIYE